MTRHAAARRRPSPARIFPPASTPACTPAFHSASPPPVAAAGAAVRAVAPPAAERRTARAALLPALLLFLLLVLAGLPAVPADGSVAPDWQRADLWGGDVRSLAFDPRDPDVVYAGSSGGHVFVSRDAGETWADAGRPWPLPGWVVSDLVFDPDVPGRLWAALWGTWGGGMVVVSDDGGESWQVRGREDLAHTQVYTLARVPGEPEHLYAGTLSGVWGSTDGGESWSRLTGHLPEVHKVTSLLVGPEDGRRVIAGTWQRAYRSDDGGASWYGVFEGMLLDSEVFTLIPVPGRPDEIWASTCGWVYRTGDAGGRWQRFKEGFENRRTPAFAALPPSAPVGIAGADPSRPGRLLAGTVAGLHVSDDGGGNWRRVGPADLSIFEVAYHPARPRRVLLATEGSGVWLSEDGGSTLRQAATGMRNLRVAALAQAGREVLAAVNHAGPASGIHASRDGGRTFEAGSSLLPPVRDLVVHGVGVYAATERGLYERAGGAWRMIGEIGPRRVEQVVSAGGRLVVRTPDGLWEQQGPRFRQLAGYHHGAPRSASLEADGGALWVSDGAGLYRLAAGSNDTVEVPFPGGRVVRFGERLAWWGRGGAWVKPAAGDPWVRVAEGPVRLLPTGDDALPALLVGEGAAHLLDPGTGALHPVDLPLPPEEILSALLRRPAEAPPRLLLGTAGHGLYLAWLGGVEEGASS